MVHPRGRNRTRTPPIGQTGELMRAIMKVTDRPEDFFAGNNGWRLPVDPMPGWIPPDKPLRWMPYVDSDQALGAGLRAGELADSTGSGEG